MTAIPERRRGTGRRITDRDGDELRAILHDIGHAVATVRYLVDAALSEGSLAASARKKLELAVSQTRTLNELIGPAVRPSQRCELVSVRSVLAELCAQADACGQARVALIDGPSPMAEVNGTALWRILSNLLGNAIRAVGPDGTVLVEITEVAPIVITIADDGPGFGAGEPGWASLGLATVNTLSRTFDIDVSFERHTRIGTVTRVAVPVCGQYPRGEGT
ncbi:MAG TPA: ATP-binding protein [Amycolatopsis sp.]|nr:ATP-binding protein [Amycolatopsis sp.]